MYLLGVLVQGFTIDYYIIQIHHNKLIYKGIWDLVHEVVKYCGGISEIERYDKEFKESIIGHACCL